MAAESCMLRAEPPAPSCLACDLSELPSLSHGPVARELGLRKVGQNIPLWGEHQPLAECVSWEVYCPVLSGWVTVSPANAKSDPAYCHQGAVWNT